MWHYGLGLVDKDWTTLATVQLALAWFLLSFFVFPHLPAHQRGDSKHVKQASVPVSLYKSSGEGAGLGPDARAATHVMRSKSDVASRRNRAGLTQSTFYVSISQAAGTGCEVYNPYTTDLGA